MELVARAGETAQPQSLEAVVGLQVRKAHLHALTIAGSARQCGCHVGSYPSIQKWTFPRLLLHSTPDPRLIALSIGKLGVEPVTREVPARHSRNDP